MAAPTSQHEVTARKLSDTVSGLWGKIKDTFQTKLGTQTAYTSKGSATKVPQITTNSLGQVTGITEVAISGVTPSSHASSATTYGVGTTSKYGHVKLATGDMNGATNIDGVAVSKNHTHSQYATAANATLTGTPTAPTASSGDSSTQIATTEFVQDAVTQGLSVSDAMVYKGTVTLGASSPGGYTVAASKGHTYKVVANGTTTKGYVDGVAVEAGDMVICNTDDTAAATSSNYSTIAAKWDFVQGNLDGVVVGPGSATAGHVAVFDGSTGKLIKDGTYTIGKSVPSDAKFTDTTYTFDGTYNASTNKAATVSTVTNAVSGKEPANTVRIATTSAAIIKLDNTNNTRYSNYLITCGYPSGYNQGTYLLNGYDELTGIRSRIVQLIKSNSITGIYKDTNAVYFQFNAGTTLAVRALTSTERPTLSIVDSIPSTATAFALTSVVENDAIVSGKANDADVVHKAGAETITGIKTFNNDMSPRQAHTVTVKQSKAFNCNAITLYEDWEASQKDGNHFRAWTIDLTSTIVTASTHATIVVKMIGSYSYTPSNGSLQKEITFQIHNGNVVVSASDYTIAQSPCADEFKISGIFKSGSSYLVQVVNSKPTQNNYPLVLEIEMLSRNTSAVLDNVTMTGSIISGWPSWAGDINTPAKVTASGYPVLTANGLVTAWSGTPSDANVPSEKLVYDSMRQAPYALAHYHSEAGTTRWVCLAKVYVPVTLSGYAGEMFAMSFRDAGADDVQGVLCVTNSEYGNVNSVYAKFIVLGLRNTLYQSKVYILKESVSTYYIYSRLPSNACAKITPMLLHGTITYPNTYTTTEPSGLVNVPLVQMPPLRVVDGPQSSYEPGVCYLI